MRKPRFQNSLDTEVSDWTMIVNNGDVIFLKEWRYLSYF